MAVIKHAERDRLSKQAMVLDLGDLRRVAEAMEAKAQAEAKRIAEEARAERERILAGAFEEGFEKGRAEGLEAGLAEGRDRGRQEALVSTTEECRRLLDGWKAALDEFEQRRDDMLLDARERVLALAVAIGERIVKRVIEINPTVAADQLSAAISLMMQPSRLAVRINPEDEAVVRAVLPALMNRLGESANATIEPDAALSRGSVVVRSEGGEVDATIGTQMDRIVRAILPGAESGQP